MLSPWEKGQISWAKNDFRSRHYKNCFKRLKADKYFDHLDVEAVSMLLICAIHLREFDVLKEIVALAHRRVDEFDLEFVLALDYADSLVELDEEVDKDIYRAYAYGKLKHFNLWIDTIFKLLCETGGSNHLEAVCVIIEHCTPLINDRMNFISAQEERMWVSFFEEKVAKHNCKVFKLLLEEVLIPYFKSIQKYSELVRMIQGILRVDKEDYHCLFLYAYYCYKEDMIDEAEKTYLKYLERFPADYAALFNLSILYENKDDFDLAILYLHEALARTPDNEIEIKQRLSKLSEVQEIRMEEKRNNEVFLETAPARFHKVDFYKKKILHVISKFSEFDDLILLQKLTGIEINSLPTHVKKLVDSGMLIELKEGRYKVNQFLHPLLSKVDYGMVSKIIRSDESYGIKPIFNSGGEYLFYKVLLQIFPNLLVFPNMSLNAIFKYAFMKEELDREEFRYFLNSQVDFCITSTISYLPIIGFEVDSHYHDQDQQIVKDEMKNMIFERGGIPLIRIRMSENTTEQEIKSKLLETISDFWNQIKNFDDSKYFKLLENEVDLKSVFEIKNFKN